METGTLTDSLSETLALFDGSGEPRTTTELAEELGLGRRSTYDRLERLVERDHLRTKKVGANARVWWRPRANGAASPDWPQAAESLVDDVLDDVAVGVFVLDSEFDVAWVNETTETYFGIDREAAIGRDKRDLVAERIAPSVEDSEGFAETVLATYDDNTYTERFECHVRAGQGREERWLEHRSQPIERGAYAGGRVELYYDVSDRKHLEREREGDREEFESLVEAVDEYAIFTLDTEGYVRTWNPGARRIKGYDREEILGEHFSTFYADEERDRHVPERNLAAAAVDGSTEDEGWRVRADGSRFWANVTITAIRDDDGELQGYAKVTRDMTERRERERRLEEEISFTRSILDNQRDIVYAFDASATPMRWNDRVNEVLGYDDEAISDMRPAEFVAEEATDRVADAVARVLEDGESVTLEVPMVTADGERLAYELSATPMLDDEGDPTGFTGIGRDVSERKAKERRLARRRDELRAELDDVFTRIDDGFFALDPDWRFVHVNERAADVLESSVEELIGRTIWEAFPAATDLEFEEQYERAMETQESVSFEAYFPPLSTWFQVNAYPSEQGLSVYFRDVTERKQRERELERYETIVETVWDGVYALDPEENFVMVNDAFLEMTGYDREELMGQPGKVVHDEEINEVATREVEAVLHGDQAGAAIEFDLARKDGDSIAVETRFGPYAYDGDRYGRCGVVRDIQDRKERKRELEEYESVVSTMEDGVYVLDDDFEFVMVNDAYLEMTGYDRAELLGEHCSLVDDDVTAESARHLEEMLAGATDDGVLEADIQRADGTTLRAESRFSGLPGADGEGPRKVGVVRDVSDRVERERELERRVRQQQVVADLGRTALDAQDVDELMAEAVERVADVLDTDYCKVLDLDPTGEELLLRQGVGWREGVVGDATVSATENDSQAAYTLASAQPVTVSDLSTETRFSGPDLLRDHDVQSGISTIIGSTEDPWGILGTHDTDVREFSDNDVNFVESVATILATAINRKRDERQLLAQRERLDALNNVNEVVRETTEAVIDQSTRDEIEATVCERLVDSESYAFAWIGEADPATGTVEARTEVGAEGYLDDITITLDAEDPRSGGPTGRAFRTGEIQVTQDVDAAADHDPWRDHVDEYEFRSSAAVPIVHEGTVYGVLNVYTERTVAFQGQERTVLEQLGEIVGHAIAAVERKRALMSEEVVELAFQADDVFDDVGVPADGEGPIRLEHTADVGDGEFVVFGRAPADAVETLEAMAETIPFYEDVAVREDGEEVRFEFRVTEPPVLSTIASMGGSVEEAVVEDGDFRLVVHMSPGADVRTVIDAVTDAYPSATLLKRRQVTSEDAATDPTARRFLEELTDRQRATVEAAYYAGFFEWPRSASGEEVAETLGVASPTFHQHLRKAERKVFDAVLPSPAD